MLDGYAHPKTAGKPYKGAADAVTGVLGGQVQMFFGDIGGVLALVREGTLRALAVSSETRNAFLPDVPTMMESGVPDYVVLTYIGVVAPAGTPQDIVVKLNSAINASLASPQLAAAFAKLGAEVRPAPPQAFAAFLAAETQKWSQVARTATSSSNRGAPPRPRRPPPDPRYGSTGLPIGG